MIALAASAAKELVSVLHEVRAIKIKGTCVSSRRRNKPATERRERRRRKFLDSQKN
jgi:hypothetical protein